MTESEWLSGMSPVRMLAHLKAEPNDRKVLLFTLAGIYRRYDLVFDELSEFIEIAERIANGEADKSTRDEIQWDLERIIFLAMNGEDDARAHFSAVANVVFANWLRSDTDPWFAPDISDEVSIRVRRAHAELLRDIFGNPFRPVAFSPEWRTSTVVSLAKTMYESRDFAPMPLLADALQDAGCELSEILDHCRGQGPHVRGCWVVDLVLEKA